MMFQRATFLNAGTIDDTCPYAVRGDNMAGR